MQSDLRVNLGRLATVLNMLVNHFSHCRLTDSDLFGNVFIPFQIDGQQQLLL